MLSTNQQRLYVKNYDQWDKLCKKNWFSEKKASITSIDDGIILPAVLSDKAKGFYSGGVSDENYNFIAGFIREYGPNSRYYSVNSSYAVDKNTIHNVNEEVIFGGVLVGHFGHFILESMSRLWYVIQNRNDHRKIVFITVLKQCSWFYDFFDLLDIERDRIVFCTKPTKFKKIIIPEESVHSWSEYHNEYSIPYNYIKKNATHSDLKKVYLTRTQLQDNQTYCCNEEYFENFYREQGFCIISPEKFSIREQIGIISNADEIVCILGSLSHFALFCKKEAKFTSILRTSNDTLPPQCLVHHASGVNYTLVDASQNFLFANRATGINLIGDSFLWKKYVLDTYNISINDNTLSSECFKYIKKWCEYYCNKHRIQKIKNINAYNFTKNMFDIFFDNYDTSVLNQLKQPTYDDTKNLYLFLEKMLGRPVIKYQVHLSGKGWDNYSVEGETSGNISYKGHIEAIRIMFSQKFNELLCSSFTTETGWSIPVQDGELVGSVGKSTPINGIKIQFKDSKTNYNVLYRCHIIKNWTPWYKNGEELYFDHANALEIKIEKKKFIKRSIILWLVKKLNGICS